MKKLVDDEHLYNAFLKAELGDVEHYELWTALWAVRSKIWNDPALEKQARKSLGDLTKTAIEEGNSALFRKLADALDVMKIFERSPRNALSADIYFAVEELNDSHRSFTKAEVLAWLHNKLETGVSKEELHRELERMDLADVIPDAEESKKKA